jgi:hypothetical protein
MWRAFSSLDVPHSDPSRSLLQRGSSEPEPIGAMSSQCSQIEPDHFANREGVFAYQGFACGALTMAPRTSSPNPI